MPAHIAPPIAGFQFSLRWLMYFCVQVATTTSWILWCRSENGGIYFNWWWYSFGALVCLAGLLARWRYPTTVGMEWMAAGSLIAASAGFSARLHYFLQLGRSSAAPFVIEADQQDIRTTILVCLLPSVVTAVEGAYAVLFATRRTVVDGSLTFAVLCIVLAGVIHMAVERATIYARFEWSLGAFIQYEPMELRWRELLPASLESD